jgi:hypothetical protein
MRHAHAYCTTQALGSHADDLDNELRIDTVAINEAMAPDASEIGAVG